ncbi:hypothetical protein ACEWY4_007592 [Coilia grayii]|uniref:Reverse transcriptase RNase H-like domain-containing protein n=1 Tax=Coilia grayii TaxID=363190 RepID=A0ABD1KGW8_9TELE
MAQSWRQQSSDQVLLKRVLQLVPHRKRNTLSGWFCSSVSSAPRDEASGLLATEQDGKVRPIAYASRGLKPTERNISNYSSMKLEFLALKWALTEKFREYLLGQHCIVFTDNNPLSHLSTAKLGALEQRWVAQMAPFNYEIRYRSGRQNRNADALSRQGPDPSVLLDQTLGTALPTSLRQALPAAPVVQAVVTALPDNDITHLRSCQERDPVLQAVAPHWR